MLNFDFSQIFVNFSFIIFQEKYFTSYILLTDQVSLSNSIYFLRFTIQFVTS